MTTPTTTPRTRRRRLTGKVTSDKMVKTVVVQIDRRVWHPKYHRQYTVSRRFHAHDEERVYHIGDRVIIEETRPMSKTKRWRVIGKVGA